MEFISRFLNGKIWSWFWLVFSVVFAVVDLLVGSPVFAVVMVLIAVYWSWNLYTIYKGTNKQYNRYHTLKV